MLTAIIGSRGQLGTELQKCLPGDLIPLDVAEIDITDPARTGDVLSAARPDFVINAAAYNHVDRAEDEPRVAFAVNTFGPRNLARWCAAADIPLLHVSTDHVFSGRPADGATDAGLKPYEETDLPAPLSAYATSKLTGEYFVQAICRRYFLVRTCGLYGEALGTKGNFVETMLRLGRERDELRVVSDQRCTPTSAADLAGAIRDLIETQAWGLYHVTNSGEASWYDFACEILQVSGIATPVKPITTAEFGARAPRPSYSVLNCSKFARVAGRSLPPWQEALATYLEGRLEK